MSRAEPEGYAHDVFLSYPRGGFVEPWVRDLLLPILTDELSHLLPDRAPSIFIDSGMKPGERWPDALRRALLRSRCLVGVWSAEYFRSAWCLAEWRSMAARAEAAGGARLVLPLVVRDGLTFPADARHTVSQDFKVHCYDAEAIRHTHAALLALHRAVQQFAEDSVWPALDAAPSWSADFPIEMPEPPQPVVDFPRLS